MAIGKGPVRLRQRKLKDGTQSLYLDIYYRGQREYEYLKLYLHPGRSATIRARNRETLALAEAIAADRTVQIQRGAHGFDQQQKGRYGVVATLKAYISGLQGKRAQSTIGVWRTTARHIAACFGPDCTFRQLGRDSALRFAAHLRTTPSARKQPLHPNTQRRLYEKFFAFLRHAEREGYLQRRQLPHFDPPETIETERPHLSWEQVQRLARTECQHGSVKRAFLFSCLTGMRKGDIRLLEWGQISEADGYTRITFRQEKTRGLEYLDIPPDAAALLGERGAAHEQPFGGLPSDRTISAALDAWAAAAGLDRFTFHTGRHTFAVLQISLGTDIFTLQQLLGHRDIQTTQVYARVLDPQKRAAVSRIPHLGDTEPGGAS